MDGNNSWHEHRLRVTAELGRLGDCVEKIEDAHHANNTKIQKEISKVRIDIAKLKISSSRGTKLIVALGGLLAALLAYAMWYLRSRGA